MDKPISLSMKDYIARKMAVKMMISEKVLDTVIGHQFNSANEAMRTNESVEISGFGKFFFNKKKAVKKMEKMLAQKKHFENVLDENNNYPEHRKRVALLKLTSLLQAIEYLKPKITDNGETELQTDSGGLEEQHHPPIPSEGADNHNQ